MTNKNNCFKYVFIILVFLLSFSVVGCSESAKEDVLQEEYETQDVFGEEEKNGEVTEEPDFSNDSDEGDDAENSEADEQSEPAEEPVIFVCVPVEELPLRVSAGLGEDVIRTVSAGTLVEWNHQAEVVYEIEFYKVKVVNTKDEGYLPADYLIRYENEYVPSKLNIVNTTDSVYTYDSMVEDIYELTGVYSDVLSYEIIGHSVYGRDIYAVTLGNKNATKHVMVQAAIHGREYMTSQLVMKLLEYYACYYHEGKIGDRYYSELFDQTAFHVIPMSNPDGVTISQFGIAAMGDPHLEAQLQTAYLVDSYYLMYEEDSEGFMDWVDHYRDELYVRSENARMITYEEYQSIWKANGRGVDLNNNFNADWQNINLKQYNCYGSFKGEYPESEPETQALVKYAKRYDFLCYLSYHSRGQLIYYDCEGNSEEMSNMEEQFAESVSKVIGYPKRKTKNGHNVNLGGFGDWVQLSLNKLSVTIENGWKPCPLQIEEFEPMWFRHKELWSNIADS